LYSSQYIIRTTKIKECVMSKACSMQGNCKKCNKPSRGKPSQLGRDIFEDLCVSRRIILKRIKQIV